MVWIEFDSAHQVMLGARPGEVATQYCLAQSSVTFSKVWIEVDCSRSRFISRCRTLGKRHDAENTEPVVIVRHACIRQRVPWVERNGLLVTNNRTGESFFGKRV